MACTRASLMAILVWGCAPDPGPFTDADHDGVRAPWDCDDARPNFGLGPERPYDGVDNDCDTRTRDDDLDGDGLPLARDCDDRDAAVQRHGWLPGDLVAGSSPEPCAGHCDLTVGGSVLHTSRDDVDMDRYHCLVAVDAWLFLGDDHALEGLQGLERLAAVGDTLAIYNVSQLTSLHGLDTLSQIGRALWVESNDALHGLEGLSVPWVPRVRVADNPVLERLAPDRPLRVTDELTLRDNPRLASLEGLEVPATMTSNLTIVGTALRSLDALSGLREIGGSLVIEGNPDLVDITALQGLVRVAGGVTLRANPRLDPLEVAAWVDGIAEVGGAIEVGE